MLKTFFFFEIRNYLNFLFNQLYILLNFLSTDSFNSTLLREGEGGWTKKGKYSPEIASFELGKLCYSLFCPHFWIQTETGKLRAGHNCRSWDSRAMMIFKWWREKDKMWSRVRGVAISKFDRYYFWTVQMW